MGFINQLITGGHHPAWINSPRTPPLSKHLPRQKGQLKHPPGCTAKGTSELDPSGDRGNGPGFVPQKNGAGNMW